MSAAFAGPAGWIHLTPEGAAGVRGVDRDVAGDGAALFGAAHG